jgi:transcriptional regulator with XRE-family HTH domain
MGARLTQQALAARLGVAPNTVARWEQGVHSITEPMARLIRLMLALTKAKR